MSNPEITGEIARLLYTAEAALIRCRDGAVAINLLVRDPFDAGVGADAARNAIDWASEKLAEDIDTATEALDKIKFDRAASAAVQS